ncbi:PalH-domain-containing protein [Coleophoma crateriformis]|uniref:PalH-domain-containing protein n=1 Tax=Coleophoma crateriformis TaxID=565419 RepID=A0A3D8T9K7_9HELO|nr:PalH-domain-containing protein [Coleophoma crateriformis]
MDRRQIWNFPSADTTVSATTAHCTPFTLPSKGVIQLAASSTITLTSNAVFSPECTGSSDSILILTSEANSHTSTVTDFRDPFYASTLPECYALAACTVIAYMLFIMLLITPRTFLIEGAVVLGRRGFTNGPSGSDAGIGIGGRPWLQKVAAATVAISLTIATADTLRVAEQQYNQGLQDALALQNAVENGTELKVIRVISDTFLWLAQAQTLIRLFPRQREKIIIKWTAFALITLDVLFGILNNFVYEGSNRPQSFVDAVPALAYLFQLALSLLYCAWVMYYALTKKRYAFYHPQMRNICLVALLSLVSVLVPVVFFVLDISKPKLAGWGDYVRWVGAAAASVVVWEWVERIEALERNDRKDGVLGREVFDGDEMLEVTPTSEAVWSKGLKHRKDGGDSRGGTATGINVRWPAMTGLAHRYRARFNGDVETGGIRSDGERTAAQPASRLRPPLWPARPLPIATPISRTDTASAESTVYAIRYHPMGDATPSILDTRRPPLSRGYSLEMTASRETDDTLDYAGKPVVVEDFADASKPVFVEESHDEETNLASRHNAAWQALANVNPFRKRNQGPPPEVSAHAVKVQEPAVGYSAANKWDVRARFEEFAAVQAEKISQRKRQDTTTVGPLPVTVIPAPVRRRNLLADVEEMENEDHIVQVPSHTTEVPLTGTTFGRSQSPNPSFTQTRGPNNPYAPQNLDQQAISHRGSISFATPALQGRRTAENSTPWSPSEERSQFSPSLSNPTSPRPTTISSRQDWVTNVNSLPTISIPAPPRRPRNDDED